MLAILVDPSDPLHRIPLWKAHFARASMGEMAVTSSISSASAADIAADQQYVRYAQPEAVLDRLRNLPLPHVVRIMDDATCNELELRGGGIMDLVLALYGTGAYRRQVALKSDLLSVATMGSPLEDGYHFHLMLDSMPTAACFAFGENPAHVGRGIASLLREQDICRAEKVTDVLLGLTANRWFKGVSPREDFSSIINAVVQNGLVDGVDERRLFALSQVLNATHGIAAPNHFMAIVEDLSQIPEKTEFLVSLVSAAGRGGLSPNERTSLAQHHMPEVRSAFFRSDERMTPEEFGQWLKSDGVLFYNAILQNDVILQTHMRRPLAFLMKKIGEESSDRADAFWLKCATAGISKFDEMPAVA